MSKKKEPLLFVVAVISTDGNEYSAPIKERKQLRYMKDYANAHNIYITETVNLDRASDQGVVRYFKMMADMVKSKKIHGVIVANTTAVSTSISDAYYKVGLIKEVGGVFISVDEGRLSLGKEA